MIASLIVRLTERHPAPSQLAVARASSFTTATVEKHWPEAMALVEQQRRRTRKDAGNADRLARRQLTRVRIVSAEAERTLSMLRQENRKLKVMVRTLRRAVQPPDDEARVALRRVVAGRPPLTAPIRRGGGPP